MSLPTRVLGRTGATVTQLGYGAMEIRQGERGRGLSDDECGAILNAVLDAGITIIDTSIDYGMSEELMGRYIGHRRNEYFLASKCGCPVDPPPQPGVPFPPHDFSRRNIVAGVEQSLRRLRTDHLDLVQFHGSPSKAVLEENDSIATLRDLQQQGKIRFIGMSAPLPNLADHVEWGVFDAFQIPYSALQREHEAIITRAAENGGGTLIRGGAARGGPAEEKNWVSPLGVKEGVAKDLWDAASLDDLLQDGMSRMEFTLRFTLSHPDLHTTIVGTVNPKHLQQNVEWARKGGLPADVYQEARRRLDAVTPAQA